jgi:cyclopropane fatty-acyl-phospholipid synthase-like methyltransferase
MSDFTAADIRRYYDGNTARFVALGQGGDLGAIHRAVWAPGVRRIDEAFHYVEDRIADRLRGVPAAPHVVDLGCGVGGSLSYLAAQVPNLTATGITLSPVQARWARERMERAGVSRRVSCLEADWADLPATIPSADLVFAIEAFVHTPDPGKFLRACHRLLKPGAPLIICDDFLRATEDPSAETVVDRYRRGWHVNALLTRDRLVKLATEAGFAFESAIDLSPYLELNRPRDRALAILAALVGWLPLHLVGGDSLVGGNALRRCLVNGWIGYEMVTVTKRF